MSGMVGLRELRSLVPPYSLQSEDDAVGGGDADSRRAADAKLFDGFPGGFDRAAFVLDEFDGEARLVDQDEVAVVVADPAEGFDFCRGRQMSPLNFRRSSAISDIRR